MSNKGLCPKWYSSSRMRRGRDDIGGLVRRRSVTDSAEMITPMVNYVDDVPATVQLGPALVPPMARHPKPYSQADHVYR